MSKYPIIVLEGPDGSGKTTLAKMLVDEYGFAYRHLTYRFKDRMHLYHWAALELCLKDAETGPVVLDRWWPSETIYADVFRGGSKWPMMGRLLDRVAMKHGVTYVWCIPSNEEAYFKRFDRLKASGREMYDSMQGVYQAYAKLYNELPSRLDMAHYDLDTHGQDLGGYCHWLIDLVQEVHGAGLPYFCTDRHVRSFAGNPSRPRFLLVGDQSKPKTRRPVWPFFEHGNSSLWVTQALEQVGILECDLAWVNAHDSDGVIQDDLLDAVYEHCAPSHVVALGHRAALALAKVGIPCRLIKHPQWNRRFEPGDLRQYRALKALA